MKLRIHCDGNEWEVQTSDLPATDSTFRVNDETRASVVYKVIARGRTFDVVAGKGEEVWDVYTEKMPPPKTKVDEPTAKTDEPGLFGLPAMSEAQTRLWWMLMAAFCAPPKRSYENSAARKTTFRQYAADTAWVDRTIAQAKLIHRVTYLPALQADPESQRALLDELRRIFEMPLPAPPD